MRTVNSDFIELAVVVVISDEKITVKAPMITTSQMIAIKMVL